MDGKTVSSIVLVVVVLLGAWYLMNRNTPVESAQEESLERETTGETTATSTPSGGTVATTTIEMNVR